MAPSKDRTGRWQTFHLLGKSGTIKVPTLRGRLAGDLLLLRATGPPRVCGMAAPVTKKLKKIGIPRRVIPWRRVFSVAGRTGVWTM